ncbi:ABC transporter substrate-binding protein [Candidatus Amoebophilus asiaticus]|nr:ABC transporter substrate-binding protein [Candidatus Amoebophilus asiaticus]
MHMKNLIRIAALILMLLALWAYLKSKKDSSPKVTEKVLYTANEAQIKTLDPAQAEDHYSNREVAKVYEGLLEFHYLKKPFELTPNLAEEMPEVSADQLVYTFKIRRGVKFHDNPCFPNGKGRELTAHDFVYSFKRLADPKLQAKNFWLINNNLKEVNAWRERYADAIQANYDEEIEGVKAIDRYTLQFTLTRPNPQFLYFLGMSGCYVVPREAVEHYGMEFTNHPVGTGAFMLEAFNPQDSKLVYRKNPTFRDKRFPSESIEEYKHMLAYAGKQLPFVDKIVTYILTEAQPKWLKFKKGDLDIIDITKDKIALDVVRNGELIPDLKEKGINLYSVAELSTTYVVMNCANPLFKDNLKLRQAMALAFDKEGYNKLFHNNTAVVAQSTVPPGLAGYREDYINPYGIYDIEKAKQYLAEAGYPEGKGLPELTLDAGPDAELRLKGEFFQKCMAKIGVRIKVVGNIFPELIKKINNQATMLHSISWSADYPDAQNFFMLLYGPYQPGGIGSNLNDSAYDALYEKAVAMLDSPERTRLYEQLNEMIAEKTPFICTVHFPHTGLQHGWVKNYCWSNFHYGTEQYFDIDLEQKNN